MIKVFPKDININLDNLVETIRKNLPPYYEIKKYEKVPIAFGLSALVLSITMPEYVKGGTEELENLIRSLDEVSEVNVEYVSRI
ncbi:MAG: elongation factor 1-beta [Desulfurococcales archaeon ex4484_217_1]|nr:MAG: elongation factor 1-beta [Desulfurococcales archaeon ex4484_217_1]